MSDPVRSDRKRKSARQNGIRRRPELQLQRFGHDCGRTATPERETTGRQRCTDQQLVMRNGCDHDENGRRQHPIIIELDAERRRRRAAALRGVLPAGSAGAAMRTAAAVSGRAAGPTRDRCRSTAAPACRSHPRRRTAGRPKASRTHTAKRPDVGAFIGEGPGACSGLM